jgi:transposase
VLPLIPGTPERRTHDYKRHGTTNLYAALDVASGNVIADMTPRHRAEEFRKFLNLIDNNVPAELHVHVIVDNNSTHKTPAIQRWLVRHPRFTLHFTPTYSSWLNLVERWFGELTNRWLRRGTHRSTKELVASIRTWINIWNDNPRPFVWHKTADEILTNLATYCQRISDSGHAADASLVRVQPAQHFGRVAVGLCPRSRIRAVFASTPLSIIVVAA